jgi:hypothetical protein
VEINGVVNGDAMIAAGGVNINGAIQDDARLAGGGISVSGRVGDDLFVAGGGWPGATFVPMRIGARTITLGIRLASSATVGGDAFIVGGEGVIGGDIGGNLFSGMNSIHFIGQVGGDAELRAATLRIDAGSRVGGRLKFSSEQATAIPQGIASAVEEEQVASAAPAPGNLMAGFLDWLLRTFMILLGFALLSWLIMRFAPNLLVRPADAIEAKPVESGIYGVLIAVAVAPLSAALIFLVGLFWGWFPGSVVMFAFLFGAVLLVWILSPLITGLWIGRKIVASNDTLAGPLPTLLVGALLIALAGRVLGAVPWVGALIVLIIYLLSFVLAVGGWVLARREPTVAA